MANKSKVQRLKSKVESHGRAYARRQYGLKGLNKLNETEGY